MVELTWKTPAHWCETATRDMDAFLLDHALCERKASAVGMSFVVRYPDRRHILEPMIQFAREELEHFHAVFRVIDARGLELPADEPDPYVTALMKLARHGREDRFLDRLLISSVIEARGHERMEMVTEFLPPGELKELYRRLSRAENRHKDFFVQMALRCFPEDEVLPRLAQLVEAEGKIAAQLPFRSALH